MSYEYLVDLMEEVAAGRSTHTYKDVQSVVFTIYS